MNPVVKQSKLNSLVINLVSVLVQTPPHVRGWKQAVRGLATAHSPHSGLHLAQTSASLRLGESRVDKDCQKPHRGRTCPAERRLLGSRWSLCAQL